MKILLFLIAAFVVSGCDTMYSRRFVIKTNRSASQDFFRSYVTTNGYSIKQEKIEWIARAKHQPSISMVHDGTNAVVEMNMVGGFWEPSSFEPRYESLMHALIFEFGVDRISETRH